ncbi:protein Red [Nephila pilipes]|uniref:Protein Red n=1 Tax=Nephila pilipes TaxID=299642 RepID=A0A8X6Q8A4_NEPPI|nr:protein Red [Nephila pilipes]
MCRCVVTKYPRTTKMFTLSPKKKRKIFLDIAKERRDGVNPDYQNEDSITSAAGYRAVAPVVKFGLDNVERRRQIIQESKFLGGDMEHTYLVNGLDYDLLQRADDSRLKAKLASKLERDIPKSYAKCYPGAPEEFSEFWSNKGALP